MDRHELVENLLSHARAAMLAAVELYNKPKFPHREEIVVVQIINGWSRALQALLLRNGESIYYEDDPNRTLSWRVAVSRAGPHLPDSVPVRQLQPHLEAIGRYRDQVEHFYAEPEFRVVLYSLFQTSIINFRDVLRDSFDIRFEHDVDLRLAPLGISPPIDALAYMRRELADSTESDSVVRDFIWQLHTALDAHEENTDGAPRILTLFDAQVHSARSVSSADLIVAVGSDDDAEHLAIFRYQDPNQTHPFRQKELVARLKAVLGDAFTSYTFQALVKQYEIKAERKYCWKSDTGAETRYSPAAEAFIKGLSDSEVEAAVDAYKAHQAANRKSAA